MPTEGRSSTRPESTVSFVVYTLLVCCYFMLCCPFTGAMAVDALPKNILVFGGNGMIGSATVELLLAQATTKDTKSEDGAERRDHVITLVHRGNWYWDSAFTVRPFVRHIKCDRLHKLENCPELMGHVASLPVIDVVIDFSAYQPDSLTEALDMMQGKVKQYIYISSDSVYEVGGLPIIMSHHVCVKQHKDPTREEDAVRPDDLELQNELNGKDSYGNSKLACEEVLARYRKEKNGPAYVTLRLPDVVGPRDNTYRWWMYQLWLRLSSYLEKPVSVPDLIANAPLSLVYVNDVAEVIARLVEETPSDALDTAFNLALTHTPTLMEMVQAIKSQLGAGLDEDLKILESDESDTIRLFPSVRLGPVDVSRAESVLGWRPTEWDDVVRDTVTFYETAMTQSYIEKQKSDIIQTMQAYFTSRPYDVIRGLKAVYGLAFAERKDEL